MTRSVVVEMCPGCGSLDVRVVEPHWFAIDLERRRELGHEQGWVDRLEFGCRDCGLLWS
ncbi:hypothetical protein [Microbacterium terricola]|nr:hypothetical protein [Microbacterium terricola]UYK41138.1 hypothetical protein OAU46_05715 [Microbacterium terricola]